MSVATNGRPTTKAGHGDVLVSLTNVVKHFPVQSASLRPGKREVVHAVDGVSLEVRRGETLGLVGETGCGKSTLARCISRLFDITSGQIIFDGRDISKIRPRQLRPIRRDMQLIFQDPYGSLNPRRRVGSIIGDPFAIHGLASGQDRKRKVQELMELVGLNPEHYNRFPAEFSGGQRQRIGVARALAVNPKLIQSCRGTNHLTGLPLLRPPPSPHPPPPHRLPRSRYGRRAFKRDCGRGGVGGRLGADRPRGRGPVLRHGGPRAFALPLQEQRWAAVQQVAVTVVRAHVAGGEWTVDVCCAVLLTAVDAVGLCVAISVHAVNAVSRAVEHRPGASQASAFLKRLVDGIKPRAETPPGLPRSPSQPPLSSASRIAHASASLATLRKAEQIPASAAVTGVEQKAKREGETGEGETWETDAGGGDGTEGHLSLEGLTEHDEEIVLTAEHMGFPRLRCVQAVHALREQRTAEALREPPHSQSASPPSVVHAQEEEQWAAEGVPHVDVELSLQSVLTWLLDHEADPAEAPLPHGGHADSAARAPHHRITRPEWPPASPAQPSHPPLVLAGRAVATSLSSAVFLW